MKQKGFMRTLMRAFFITWFRVDVKGDYQLLPKSVFIANRTSSIDALLLCLFLPERLTLVLTPAAYATFMGKILGFFSDVLLIDTTNSFTARMLITAIKSGKRLVLFPEGLSGLKEEQLKLNNSTAFIIQKAGAEIVPIRIQGPQYSIFSSNKDKNIIKLAPKITLHIQATQQLAPANLHFQVKRALGERIFKLISELNFANLFQAQALFPALITGSKIGSKHNAIIEDSNRTPLTYKQFRARCFILGRQIKDQTNVDEYVGVMMPTTNAGLITFFALHAYRRIPAMLNFSMGFYNLYSACSTAGIKTIYTSKQFITTAKLESLVDELQRAGLCVRYLEDFKSSIHLGNKLSGLLKGSFPNLAYRHLGKPVDPDNAALILFTSGSEGIPKAVALSHSNILANCSQMISRVDFTPSDRFFNSLPIFHCFGLTAGSILPLTIGMNCFFYPSPLHYKIIPDLVAQNQSTIMFGTDTFLTGYARAAEKSEFTSVRYIFAGAEKVKPETTRYWAEDLGVTVYEGYGATEASPVISLNCYLASYPGSVGMILPQMEYKIIPVEGITQGGRLFLRGPNVMLGYVRSDKSGIIDAPSDGWHDTGDIVTVNANGFITILGRAKRFAKIGGEMVSLTAVEGIAASIWPELLHAAIIKKAEGKGEKILLFTEAEHADKSTFVKKVKELGQTELLVPFSVTAGCKIPVLSSGKIDYVMLEMQMSDNE